MPGRGVEVRAEMEHCQERAPCSQLFPGSPGGLRSALTDLGWEEGLVVQLVLNPGHQVVDVLGGRALDGFLNVGAVGPVILVPSAEEGGREGARNKECQVQQEGKKKGCVSQLNIKTVLIANCNAVQNTLQNQCFFFLLENTIV